MIEAAACNLSDMLLHREFTIQRDSKVMYNSEWMNRMRIKMQCPIVLSCFRQQMSCTKPDQFSLSSSFGRSLIVIAVLKKLISVEGLCMLYRKALSVFYCTIMLPFQWTDEFHWGLKILTIKSISVLFSVRIMSPVPCALPNMMLCLWKLFLVLMLMRS